MMYRDILDVLVVGGGLSGLIVSIGLERAGVNWKLVDAREALGGRIANDSDGLGIDLGGTWIWPKYQPFMKRLLKELRIQTIKQPGDISSVRVHGGAIEVVNRLAHNLPHDRILLNSPVATCSLEQKGESCDDNYVRVVTLNNQLLIARRVVFAVPPVLLSRHVTFRPPLTQKKESAMVACESWMTGVTKISLVYPEKYWDPEYSNIAIAGDGPAFQMYDASSEDGKVNALTFFTLVSHTSPAYTSDSFLALQVSQQLSNQWTDMRRNDLASKSSKYCAYYVKRWPTEAYISDDESPTKIKSCPDPVPALSETEWNGALHFAGSETDQHSPGIMEGAVGSAFRVLKEIESEFKVSI